MRRSGRTFKQLSALVEKVREGESCLFIVQNQIMRDYVWRMLVEQVAPYAQPSGMDWNNYSFSIPGSKGRLLIRSAHIHSDQYRGVRLDKIETDHSLDPSPMQAEQINKMYRHCLR